MKNFDWNAPFSKKEYAITCGAILAIYAVCAAGYYIYSKIEENKMAKELEEERKRIISSFTKGES